MNEEQPKEGFIFTIVEDDGENVTIEVSEEDYQRELAAGVDEESCLPQGRYKDEGGFLARHPEMKVKAKMLLRACCSCLMMRLPKFDYRVPREIAEAVKIMAGSGPEGQFVAGGTDLYPNMKRRQQTPRTVISVMRLPELNQISGDVSSGLRIGACVTLTDICEHPVINRDYPVVAHAARTISTPILRNMGTIGGNLLLDTRCNYYDQNYEWRKGINFCLKKDGDVCWVAPGSSKCWAVQSSDLVPVMVAIGAKLRFASTLGERMIDAAGLYNDDGIDYLHKRPGRTARRYSTAANKRLARFVPKAAQTGGV